MVHFVDGPRHISRQHPAGELAVLELHEIAGMHPIATEEFNKLPPLPHLPIKRLPKEILDHALSIRRFQIVPNREGSGFLIISHLRFFSRLWELGGKETKIQVEVLHGLTADAIRQRVHADIYDAALIDGVPIPALPIVAERLEAEYPSNPGRSKAMGGKEMVASCFGVDIRRFQKSKKPREKDMTHPERAAA